MTVVKILLVFSQCIDTYDTQKSLYLSLAKELIDNMYYNPIGSCRNPTSEDLTHNGIELIDLTGRA